MTKLGEGHPPPGVAMVRSRWHISFNVVATLLKKKWRIQAERHMNYWIKALRDWTVMRQCKGRSDYAWRKP